MKATEVLNRYANGERDFRRANLRGQSFKGQDLSGADFTEADIRGTNFTNATLKGANFTGAKAGLQKQWEIGQLIIAILVANVFSGAAASFNSYYVATYFDRKSIEEYTFFPGVTVLLIIAFIFVFILYEGLTARTAIAISLGLSFAIFAAASLAFASTGAGAAAFVFAGSVIAIIAFASAISIAIVVTGFVPNPFKFSHSLSISSLTIASIFFTAWQTNEAISDNQISNTGVQVVSAAIISLSLYIAWQALKGEEKFSLIRTIGVVFGGFGGTSFCGANLTQVNFSNAILNSTNFNHTKQSQTILEWVCWHDVKQLDRARVGNSILANPVVRELLVTHNGYKKSYINAKLRTANLNGVNLEGADLTWADLSCAHLRQANLKDAKLIEVLALDTDFTGATLTGACLEAWNIDSNTKLEGVDCQYVYLLRNQQERRPSSGDFAPGEFTKLFQEALNTVDLIFRNGVDWKAFVAAFKTVQVDNDGTELTIQGIENKGDGVVIVRVSVPETADKAKLHSEFNQNYDLALKALEAKYHAELKAKDEQITIYREKSADMTEILRLLANRPVTVEVNASAESKAMSDSTDKSQSVNIGGNVTGSTLNLGAISGSVSNVVNQLPSASDPAQPGIKELLIELQAAIESDADLPEKGKASALENVKVLAEVAQDPEQSEKKGLGSQAVTFLKGAASFLPDTAKLAEACTKLLPLITKALGLPF